MENIIYGFYKSYLGEMVLGKTGKGVCWLGFMVEGYKGNGYERMRSHFKNADFTHDNMAVKNLGDDVINAWEQGAETSISLDIYGTDFQKTVWQNLLNIKNGEVKSYGDIACAIGKPKAGRAVGTAVGSNPISLIIPCHRILKKTGAIGNYGWGVDLKRRILLAEGVDI